jgi:NAD(P)-dependent dehydrogenase (short-subunit alcohol dehydrogenase family)
MQIGTNHLAHFLLFQMVKPLLLQSAKDSETPSRVVVVASTGHRKLRVQLLKRLVLIGAIRHEYGQAS